MLKLVVREESFTYVSGVGINQSFTRYAGEYWNKTAAHLLCGIADVFPDVGLIVTAEADALDRLLIETTEQFGWSEFGVNADDQKSIWHLSDARWVFVPWCREAVEDVMTWTIPYLRGDSVTKGSLSTVFSGNSAFRKALNAASTANRTDRLNALIEECSRSALFQLSWSWSEWTLIPGLVDLNHLLKIADPVVAQINAVNTD